MTQLSQMYEEEKIEYGNQMALKERERIAKALLDEDVDMVMIMKATRFTEEELLHLKDDGVSV